MATITLKGNPIHTSGDLPAKGAKAPAFQLVKTDLSNVGLADFAGKRVVLNIFPSVDTPVCAASVRAFNAKLASLENTVVLCVSEDLPFAHRRFCAAEGIENCISVSTLRDRQFGENYGSAGYRPRTRCPPPSRLCPGSRRAGSCPRWRSRPAGWRPGGTTGWTAS